MAHGVEARHLRMYKVAAEREAGVFEQFVMPLLKQRNPGLAPRPPSGSTSWPCLAVGARRHAPPGVAGAPRRLTPELSCGGDPDGVVGVRVELPSNTPIVLLRELEGNHRMLPIFIGGPEATAIALRSTRWTPRGR